jgi:hypothetical protein
MMVSKIEFGFNVLTGGDVSSCADVCFLRFLELQGEA